MRGVQGGQVMVVLLPPGPAVGTLLCATLTLHALAGSAAPSVRKPPGSAVGRTVRRAGLCRMLQGSMHSIWWLVVLVMVAVLFDVLCLCCAESIRSRD